MTGARLGPTRDFRPSRTTRSTTAATTAGATGAGATGSSGTIPTRSRSTSRPPSGVGGTNSRPGSAINANAGTSRSGSSTGIPIATRPGAGVAGTTNGPSASGNGPGQTAGAKRKTRATSGDTLAEKEPTTSKRPALSSAFSAHLTQTSLNRQLLVAQNQITELQNSLLEKQRDIDRLEADLRLVSTREEEERGARVQSEEELSKKITQYETELSSLKRRLVEIEADHDDLSDAYSNLSHTSQSKIATLNVEISTRDERISNLEQQLKDAMAKTHEEEIRAKELENLLEQLTEGEPGEDGTQTVGKKEAEGEQQRSGSTDHQKEVEGIKMEFKEPETSADESTPDNANADDKTEELESNADADGEADLDEEVSMVVDTTADDDVTPVGDMDISSIRSASDVSTFYERDRPEIPAYPDPGAPPPYIPSSPSLASSHSTPPRLRSAPSVAGSETSSRAMSVSLDGPQNLMQTPETPLSVASISRLDSLSRIRGRLSLASSVRRHSSLEACRSRERDNEIIRAELARQVPHMTRLEETNRHLMNEIAQLRKQIGNIEVLREEKRDMERRLEGMEVLRARVAELETAAAEFAHKEQEWQARLRNRGPVNDENSTPAKTPVGVTHQLAALRRTHAVLLDEHGELKAALRANEVELAGARQEVDEATRNSDRLSKEVEQLQAALARKEKERTLLERDVAFMRSLISSYKNEEAANTSIEGEQNAGTEKLEQRVVQLEALLLEYKAAIASLQEEVDRLQRSSGRTSYKSQQEWDQLLNKAVLMGEAFKNAQAEVSRQADRVEELEQRLFELGGEIGTGRHIPPATRVLTLRQNPAQEWADTRQVVLDRLKTENEALIARIKELEESGLSATPATSEPNSERAQLVPRASWEALKKETEEQAAAIAQKEKRLLRLQQVYSAKSTEFREAIESILGLKIAFYPNGQVRLTSIYDLSAAFVFQSSKDESGGTKMQLIAKGDKCPEELEGLMNIWIRDEMNIPCFMSSITLECYDRSKRGEVDIDFE